MLDIVFWHGEKLLKQSPGHKLQGLSGKDIEKSTVHLSIMSIKGHFLHCHLNKFLDSCCNVSDELREWFHWDIKTMEER